MKIYARQVNPEYQDAWWFDDLDAFDTESLCVCGNRDYKEITNPIFKQIMDVLEAGELAEELCNPTWYETKNEAINDYLYKCKRDYTEAEIEELDRLLNKYDYFGRGKEKILCDVLSIVTGETWNYKTIRGVCQSDWNTAYYMESRWNEKQLEYFETEYFNTGSEWEIHDEDNEPESAEDVNGYHVYCHEWNDNGIKQEIANNCYGGNAEDVVLFKYVGSRSMPIYEIT